MTLPSELLPKHIAVIMDGNGRWAQERKLPRTRGHKAGADAVGTITDNCLDIGIKWLTLYAFSSENWNRPQKEINTLMNYLHNFLKKETPKMVKKGIKFHTIGNIQKLPLRCQEKILIAKTATKDCDKLNLVLALSYGARDEITQAAKHIAQQVQSGILKLEDISAEQFSQSLDTANMPDPDLLIRTSGEMRLSNFLLWQLSYAEIIILQKNWPDFCREDLLEAINSYSQRNRRFGAL